jgi:hypothetical protein
MTSEGPLDWPRKSTVPLAIRCGGHSFPRHSPTKTARLTRAGSFTAPELGGLGWVGEQERRHAGTERSQLCPSQLGRAASQATFSGDIYSSQRTGESTAHWAASGQGAIDERDRAALRSPQHGRQEMQSPRRPRGEEPPLQVATSRCWGPLWNPLSARLHG